jgi:hypothetical protein
MPRRAQPPPPERLRRPEPARTAPDRSGWHARAGLGSAEPQPDATATDHVQRAISDAVALGYQVVEENLQHGREAAARYAKPNPSAADLQHDLTHSIGRMLELASDLGRVWMEMISGLVADPRVAATLERAFSPETGAPEGPKMERLRPAETKPRPLTIACEVVGHPRAKADPASIEPRDAPEHLHIGPLQARQPHKPDITRVALVSAGSGEGARAIIHVPEDQPPGIYNGPILAGPHDEMVGNIRLVIPE